ncbi:MAG: TIR domain-containing protein [Anaerolineaceae bacterium]|nr:TIR domain-containing protein [Anaerolineaceae bacterium]
MPSAFISYRREDSASLATLIAVQLKERHGIDAYVDTRNTDSGGLFPDRLRTAIDRAEVFVCLLGADTLKSPWVLTEIEHAHDLGKVMIPIFQERYIAPNSPPAPHIEALLQYDGVHILDIRNLYVDEAIAQLAVMIRNSVPTTISTSSAKSFSQAPKSWPPFYGKIAVIIGIVIFLLALAILAVANLPSSLVASVTNVLIKPSETSVLTQISITATLTDTAIPTSITTSTPPTLTDTPTIDVIHQVQTLDAKATNEQATVIVQSSLVARVTAYFASTQEKIFDQTKTATAWTNTPTPSSTNTAIFTPMPSYTATFTPTIVPTLTPVSNTPIPSTATASLQSLGGTFEGEWASNDGKYLYGAVYQIDITNSGKIKGQIEWTLLVGPNRSKVEQTAIEYISGAYNDQTRTMSFRGVSEDDPNGIIDLFRYVMVLSSDGKRISGKSYDKGGNSVKIEANRK